MRTRAFRPPTPNDLLAVFRQHGNELVSSKTLKETLGPQWKEALHALLDAGYNIETTLGASGNKSFRLHDAQPSGPNARKGPPPVIPSTFTAHAFPSVRVTLRVEDIRTMLKQMLPPHARDTLVGALMALEDTEGRA